MRLGLGARLAIAFAVLAALTAFVTAGVSASSTARQVSADIDRFLRDRAGDIAEGRRFDAGVLPGNPLGRPPRTPVAQDAAIGQLLDIVESDAEVQILGADGEVLVALGVELPVTDADSRFLERRSSPLLRTVEIDGEQYRLITQHVDGGGLVQVAQSLRTTNTLLGELRTELLIVGVVMSALSALVGWAIASRTTKPLRQLTRAVESVAATEDLSTPVALDRGDEIGRLSEEFDGLLKTLSASRNQQRRLVQDAAHELRTPLTSVRANIDFLARADDVDEPTRQSTLTSVRAELAELSAILAEVVELATESRDAAQFEIVDLVTVAEAAISQFELRSARPVSRRLDSCLVLGEHAALTRAAANLIGNADKYSPAGAAIEVGVGGGSLWVSDQGPGIAPVDRPYVFDRFYRGDWARSAPGSGLGLAIVAKTAAEHGGGVWVRDSPGGGAEVGFTLPVAPTAD